MAIAEALGRLPLFVRIPLLILFGLVWMVFTPLKSLFRRDRERWVKRKREDEEDEGEEDDDEDEQEDEGEEGEPEVNRRGQRVRYATTQKPQTTSRGR